MSTKHQRRFLWAFCGVLLCALSAAAQTFPISTSFFSSVTWTNTTGNRLQVVRVVESLTAAQVNTGRIYVLSTTATNMVAEKADAAFRTLLWPSATGTVYIYSGDRIRATVSTTNRAFLTIDALAVEANVITNITETDPVWTAFRTGATAVAIGTGTDAGAGGVALGWQATGYNNGAAVGVLADAAGGQAAALGREANANNSGAAVGYQALGGNSGVAVGNGARGRYAGVAVGYGAKGTNFGTAIGYTAEAAGIGNAALGGSDVATNRAYVPPTMTDTVEIGRGTAISNGWLHWRGVPIADPTGGLYSAGVRVGTGSSGGGDMTTISNWVKAIAPLASNALPLAGGTMTSNAQITMPIGYITITSELNGDIVLDDGAVTANAFNDGVSGMSATFTGQHVGNGASLTNLPSPFTNFYETTVSTLTNRIVFAVPSNSAWRAIEASVTTWQTNDATQGFFYWRANGISGTNALHAYQSTVANNTTISGASGSNDASGAYCGRIYSPRNYSNAVSQLTLKIFNPYNPYPAKPFFSHNFAKPRTIAGVGQQYSEWNDGCVSVGGVITQIEILAVGTMFDTGTVAYAGGCAR